MSNESRDLEQLVEEVTAQVRRRLSAESAGLPVVGPRADAPVCQATRQDCDGNGRCAVRKEPVLRNMVAEGAVRFSSAPGTQGVAADLADYIDHTLLNPDATSDDLARVCREAREHHFKTVCVNAANIPFVARCLAGSGVMPIAVVGFPLGAATTAAKAYETRDAVANGAQEIDMVINVGALKSRDYARVLKDIRGVVEAAAPVPVKVILETALLDDEEKVAACALSKSAGAAFVKTSTGFGPGGATIEDVKLMRAVVGKDMGVKASGGVRTTDDARAMIAAGANRIGASASVAIVEGRKEPKKVSPVPGQKQY